MNPLEAYEDPSHPGNGPEHHTGKVCITQGCDRPAGTKWSPHWCFECNMERIKRINRRFSEIGTPDWND